MNRNITYILLLINLLFLIGCEKETNWYENFKENSKDPFGLYILHNEYQSLFGGKKLKVIKENIYDYLNNNYIDTDNPFNYVVIKRNANKITENGVQELLYYVSEGSTAFFSLNYFSAELQNALGFKAENLELGGSLYDNYNPVRLKKYKGELSLVNPNFEETKFQYNRNLRRNYFTSFNDEKSIVLGTQTINGKEEPIFLKVYYGKGAIYLHTQPSVFSNYHMLNNNYQYAANVLSYLPNNETLWDPLIRRSTLDSNKTDADDDENSESVFAFFLGHKSLKWSLYLGLIGLLTFMLFNARRKQRAIPILEPPKNSTIEFTHTIANLYLLNKDHKNIVNKKIRYFLEKVRTRYYIETRNLNKEFVEKLALKTGNDLQTTQHLIDYILTLDKKTTCTSEEVLHLHKLIDNFLKR